MSKKILIVYTSWYEEHISEMLKISKEILEDFDCSTSVAPGALELSALANQKILNSDFKGVLFLGIVIRGETSHYDYVCTESARALMDLSIDGFAIGYGILTVENYEQAMVRSMTVSNKGLGKGKVAALACINQINLKIKYTNGT